jgi:hypothetical protein
MQEIIVDSIGKDRPDVYGGFNHKNILIAPLDWFTTIGAPKALHDSITAANEGVTFAELGSISVDHVFPTGKGFMTVEGAQETTDLKAAYLGEGVNKIVENKTTIVLEGSSAELVGFSRWVKNKRFVILIQETEEDLYRQLGSLEYGAMFTELDANIEALREGASRRTFTLTDKQRYEAPVYLGTVTKLPNA